MNEATRQLRKKGYTVNEFLLVINRKLFFFILDTTEIKHQPRLQGNLENKTDTKPLGTHSTVIVTFFNCGFDVDDQEASSGSHTAGMICHHEC